MPINTAQNQYPQQPISTHDADIALAQAMATGDQTKIQTALSVEVSAYQNQYVSSGVDGLKQHLAWVESDPGLSQQTPCPHGQGILEEDIPAALASSTLGNTAADINSYNADPSAVQLSNAATASTELTNGQALAVTLYPSGQPTVSDLHQGGIGDCDTISALAGLAMQSPSTITNAIGGPDTSGDYQVKLFDPSGQPVSITVTAQLLSQNGQAVGVKGADGKANWGTVMESALMKYNAIYGSPGIGGEGSEHAMQALTGSKTSYAVTPGSQTAAQLADTINASIASGAVITGGFTGQTKLANGDQVVPGHGYLVMGTVTGSDGQTYVQVRNPWGAALDATGKGYNIKNDGIDLVPIDQFQQIGDLRVISPSGSHATSA